MQLELGNVQSVLSVQFVSVIGSSDVVGIAILLGSIKIFLSIAFWAQQAGSS